MTQRRGTTVCLVLAALVGTAQGPRADGPLSASVLATGLKFPVKILVTPGHNILVSEAGDLPPNFVKHDGRVSIVDPAGNVRTLIGKLPTGLDLDNVNPSGPTGLALRDEDTLYVEIGPGDALKRNATNQEVPNPAGLSSSLYSSVWRFVFSASVDAITEPFTLDPATHYAILADGKAVQLTNSAGDTAVVEVLADVRDIVPGPNVVAVSNPFGLLVRGPSLYFPDAGYNSVTVANAKSGRLETITHFPAVPNTAGFGPPVSQAVPNSIRGIVGREHLAMVTLFSGFPFGPGASSVRLVDLKTGDQTPLVSGLTLAIDSIGLGRGTNNLLVLEYASGFVPPGPGGPAQFVAPGRILRFATPTSVPEVLVTGLLAPTSMDLDRETRDLYITEVRTGQLMKVTLP